MTATTATPADAHKKATRKKIVASTAVLAGVAAVAGMGAFALFTDSGTATTTVDAGELGIVMDEDYTVANIAPGDTIQRPVTIELPDADNDGDLIESVNLSYTTDPAGTTAGTDDDALPGPGESLVAGEFGLNYRLLTCEGGTWTTTTDPTGPYTCTGGIQVTTATGKLAEIATATPAVLTPADFGVEATSTGTFPTDTTDDSNLTLETLLELQLPSDADNDYENATAAITFTGTAIQRDGIQK